MTAVEVLLAVLDRVGDRERWCRGAYALDKDDRRVDPNHPDAVRWCVIGACWVAQGRVITKATSDAMRLLNIAAGKRSATDINDHECHARVVGLIRRAIEIA